MSLRKKLIGNREFYGMVLGVAVPIMVQNGITNFVSLLDNIMVGRVGTEQMSGIAIVNQLLLIFNLAILAQFPVQVFLGPSFMAAGTIRASSRLFVLNFIFVLQSSWQVFFCCLQKGIP